MKILDSLSVPPSAQKANQTVGERFEEQFLTVMLKQMQRSTPGLFGEGPVAEAFADEMLRGLAGQLNGGFGLAQHIDEQMTGLPMQAPLENMRVSSPFGHRVSPISGKHVHHDGMDLAAPTGTPIRPVRPGIVRHAGEINGFGLTVIVDHGDGVESLYAHMDAIDVQKGDAVMYSSELGKVGSTGRSTGPHLHLEIREDGQAIDPGTFF